MVKALTIYEGVNALVLSFVPPSANRILDIGCGTGALGARLQAVRERYIVGITYAEQEAAMAREQLSQAICADLNGFDFSPLGKFDCVIMSHILEHLHSPEDFLQRLKCALEPQSVLVVALPNVVVWRQRLEFLFGRWRYRDWGILDRTHFRFFDRKSSRDLLEQAGYEILRSQPDGTFPFIKPVRNLIGGLAQGIDGLSCSLMPGLFAFQFVYLARVKK